MPLRDPHSFANLSQGRITHIDFDIQVDFTRKELAIEATYAFDQPIHDAFFLDTRALTIERIYTGERDLAWELDKQDPILGERLHVRKLDSATEMTIELRTAPGSTALQWLTPKQTAGGEHPFLYSQCQSIHARSIFPCQDTPLVRFTYHAKMQVPPPLIGVMAAASLGVEDQTGRRIHSFAMKQPIPSYLFALAAGDLAFKKLGPRTGIYAENETIDAAAWEFAENEQKLKLGEGLFGPYLWERYDAIVMPPSFPYGGMENPRLTFMSTIFIMGDRSWTSIISHELAHSWTGNLVTNASWEHFWLNEGWTVYAEMRITEALEGRDVADLETVIYGKILQEELELFGMQSPITCLKTSLEGIDPDEVFSRIPYYKGFLFIRQLEHAVGRERFDAFTKKYIQTFQFQSLTSEGFVTFLEKELPQAFDHVDVQAWIYAPGLPEGALDLNSSLHDDALDACEQYLQGKPLSKQQITKWRSGQVYAFLLALPERITAEDCAVLDALFEFESQWNCSLRTMFLVLGIRSGYREIMPRVERFVQTFGRGTYLTKIFRNLVAEHWTRPQVRPLFERIRERHHPVVITNLEKMLANANL
ncbi:MAG TPA: M1 family metallopeptidase [Anaerolineae bacterium]|nr:M1 family metallopeptidase [Anaerolineae bacterium]